MLRLFIKPGQPYFTLTWTSNILNTDAICFFRVQMSSRGQSIR